jgi:hypothetical protein
MLRSLFDEPMSLVPCPRCLTCLDCGVFHSIEAVLPLPVFPSLARDGSGVCCRDCEAADLLDRISSAISFTAARVAVAETRREQFRIPGIPLGLVGDGIVRCNMPGDFEKHWEWLRVQFPNHPQLE